MTASLEYNELYTHIVGNNKYQHIKNFVETGTYLGETCIDNSTHFDTIYTIEIMESLYEKAVESANKLNINNINFYLGDSLQIIPEIMSYVKDGAIFFIDSHISGTGTGYNGVHYVPLLEELEIILDYKFGPSVFIFNCTRFWKGSINQVWDWEHITFSKVIDLFIKKNIKLTSFYEENDKFWVFTD